MFEKLFRKLALSALLLLTGAGVAAPQGGQVTTVRGGPVLPTCSSVTAGLFILTPQPAELYFCNNETGTFQWSLIPSSSNIPTSPNGVPLTLTSTPSGGGYGHAQFGLSGVPTNPQTGTTYTFAATDRATYVSFSNAGAIAVTLPQANSAGFGSNFVTLACNIGVGTATITPTTSNISFTNGSAYTSAAASLALLTGQCAWIYSDNINYFAVVRTGGISGLTTGFIPKAGSATSIVNSLCDEGITTANVLTCTDTAGVKVVSVQTGTSPPACTVGTAGFWCASEGTAPTNVASTSALYPDSTTHEFMGTTNGASTATPGMMVRSQPSPISLTGKTAAIANGTVLCAAAAGACNVAGQYRITAYFDSTVTCATPGPAAIGFNLTWVDEIGTKTAQSVPLDVNGATALTATMIIGDTTHNATGTASIWSTGASQIGYGVTYTACTSGTGTYAVRIVVERLQ